MISASDDVVLIRERRQKVQERHRELRPEKWLLVEPGGLEPPASALQRRRSP